MLAKYDSGVAAICADRNRMPRNGTTGDSFSTRSDLGSRRKPFYCILQIEIRLSTVLGDINLARS